MGSPAGALERGGGTSGSSSEYTFLELLDCLRAHDENSLRDRLVSCMVVRGDNL